MKTTLRKAAFGAGVFAAFVLCDFVIDFYLMPAVARQAQRWDLLERIYVSQQPVPTFRPSTHNSRIAIDITPNGNPVPDIERGVAWFDPCDADLRSANNNVATTCLGLSVGIPPENPKTKQRDVAFGTYNYDGAAGARFFIVKDRKKIGEFVDGGLVIYGKITASEFVRKENPAVVTSK